jgi:large subunit ribosomal protein L15
MSILSTLVAGTAKKTKLLGRGLGCKHGKTCGRGQKGAGARSGYKRRYGKEGGQFPLFKKLPIRGFSRGRFIKEQFAINLSFIESHFADGEIVSLETLHEKKRIGKKFPSGGLKILANGEITKKVTIEAASISKAAIEKLEKASIPYKIVEREKVQEKKS